MEWKKVRTWLILLVLAADLVLAGNIGWQLYQMRRSELRAVQDALTLAEQAGILLREEQLRQLPRQPEAYQVTRDGELEGLAAQALLDAAQASEPGGGVAIYQSEKGQLSFRRGGAVELFMVWTEENLTPEGCRALLEQAGFPMEQAALSEGKGSITLTQQYLGAYLYNCRLQCTRQEGQLQVRGRWLMSGERGAETEHETLSRAQLVLALCSLLEQRGVTEVQSLEAGYYLQSEDPQTALLVPVWAVETPQGRVIMSCLDGTELNY